MSNGEPQPAVIELPPPRRGNLNKYKTILIVVCCITCLLLEGFILIYTSSTSKSSGESNERIRKTLEEILLRLLALPVGSGGGGVGGETSNV